jgi:hypothetical protein
MRRRWLFNRGARTHLQTASKPSMFANDDVVICLQEFAQLSFLQC